MFIFHYYVLVITQVKPIRRLLNEGTSVKLTANLSNVVPPCDLDWYFATTEFIDNYVNSSGDNCTDGEPHGIRLSETESVNSLEENFLLELSDFDNETMNLELTVTIPAAKGRVRLVAKCGCSAAFSCETEGEVYGDVFFELNPSPKPGDVLVSPVEGTALETKFRISTLPVLDAYKPVRYSFFYKIERQLVPLGSHFNYVAVESVLPFIETGVQVVVETCDGWGACSMSNPVLVVTSPTNICVNTLCEIAQGQLKRCEMNIFTNTVTSSLLTLKAQDSKADLDKFSSFVKGLLEKFEQEFCIENTKDFNKWINIINGISSND